MANEKILMADTINRFAKDYEAMVKAAEMLKKVGTLEQIEEECKVAADKAQAELALVEAEAKKAKADAAKAKDKVAEMIAKANDQALEVIREAEQKAQAIEDAAKAAAAGVTARAESDADNRRAGVAGQVAQLTSTKVHLEQDVASLQDVITRKQIEAEDLEKRIAKAQAQIAKLLG